MPTQRAAPSPLQPALWDAVLHHRVEDAQALLAQGARANHTRGTKCLLARALEGPDSRMATALLDAGARIDGRTHGGSLLALVLQRGFEDLLPAFVAQGADLAGPVSTHEPLTAAGMAAAHQNGRMLRALAAMGVPTDRATRDQPPKSVLELWIGFHKRKHDPTDQAWWDTVDWLLARPPAQEEHAVRLVQDVIFLLVRRAALGGAALSDALLERLVGSLWWSPAVAQVAFVTLLAQGQFDRAWALREKTPVDLGERDAAVLYGPWQHSPVATVLDLVKRVHGDPKATAKARQETLVQLDRLLAHGADVAVNQSGWPLLFWAIDTGMPEVAIERLVAAGADLRGPKAPLGRPRLNYETDTNAWNEASLLHLAVNRGDLGQVKALLRAAPDLIHARDERGLTPWLRAFSPIGYAVSFLSNQRTLRPLLEVLLSHEACAEATTHLGNNAWHLLAGSRAEGERLVDFDAVVDLLLDRFFSGLTRLNADGVSGRAAIVSVADSGAEAAFADRAARAGQHQLDDRWAVPKTAAPAPRPRM